MTRPQRVDLCEEVRRRLGPLEECNDLSALLQNALVAVSVEIVSGLPVKKHSERFEGGGEGRTRVGGRRGEREGGTRSTPAERMRAK